MHRHDNSTDSYQSRLYDYKVEGNGEEKRKDLVEKLYKKGKIDFAFDLCMDYVTFPSNACLYFKNKAIELAKELNGINSAEALIWRYLSRGMFDEEARTSPLKVIEEMKRNGFDEIKGYNEKEKELKNRAIEYYKNKIDGHRIKITKLEKELSQAKEEVGKIEEENNIIISKLEKELN